jgi:hypothetical protein
MEISPKPGKELRSKIGGIATAIAFAVVICSVAVEPARAADQRGHDRGGDQHHDNRDRGVRRPDVHYAPQPDYYYAPAPNYYYAPEPDYYYAPEPPPPPEGIQLFFGF